MLQIRQQLCPLGGQLREELLRFGHAQACTHTHTHTHTRTHKDTDTHRPTQHERKARVPVVELQSLRVIGHSLRVLRVKKDIRCRSHQSLDMLFRCTIYILYRHIIGYSLRVIRHAKHDHSLHDPAHNEDHKAQVHRVLT